MEEIVPMPPHWATAEDNRWAETPTPMPPWTMGKSKCPLICRASRPLANNAALKTAGTELLMKTSFNHDALLKNKAVTSPMMESLGISGLIQIKRDESLI
jgi:hypothetical protein